MPPSRTWTVTARGVVRLLTRFKAPGDGGGTVEAEDAGEGLRWRGARAGGVRVGGDGGGRGCGGDGGGECGGETVGADEFGVEGRFKAGA